MSNKRPKSVGGWDAIRYSLKQGRKAGGFLPLLKGLNSKNSCKSCALGMGGAKGGMRDEKGGFPAVCNKSFLAQASDMQQPVEEDFFEKHDIATLQNWSPRDLENSGRLQYPLICEEGQTHYKKITWDEALDRLTTSLKTTSPDRTFFYASGRSSNEAGFLLQLFARVFGTNNVNNCSYYCHQASGEGMSQSLGTGTATIKLEDLDETDLIFLIGANPPSNHPRFMKTLLEIRRRGGKVIVINPAREPGLVNFKVPSDLRSLLLGSEIASDFIQPHIGGDIALMKGIAKGLLQLSKNRAEAINLDFIDKSTESFLEYRDDIENTSWEDIESHSGVNRQSIEKIAEDYASAKNVVFAWAMGITHHNHGVENVQSIVNIALLRGMVGRKNAGLLPLRGHSNVQGIGSIGFTPALKKAILDNLQSGYQVTLPTQKGMDTLSCMDSAHNDEIDFAWNLGGNLYGSNPDAKFSQESLSKIGFTLYMNTTLNQSHFRGMGKTTLILPVLSRDEEPEPTTQESMFSFVRLSEGGPARYPGPRSEVKVVAEIARRVLPEGSIPWKELSHTGQIREMIGSIVPGFDKMKSIDDSKEEFHVEGRALHSPEFPRSGGKAEFKTFAIPDRKGEQSPKNSQFRMMTVRSEGQFNTVVYDLHDKYRGIKSRNVVLMSEEDIIASGLNINCRVRVRNTVGEMTNLKLLSFPIKPGNVMMYYPEANVLVSRRDHDKVSMTPSFKSVEVTIEKDS
ncbi:MAG: FdhF/YdeP family oxidoreductase [Nitrospinales bacterium]